MLQDIFDSYAEYMDICQKAIKKQTNKQILLFNIPGFFKKNF